MSNASCGDECLDPIAQFDQFGRWRGDGPDTSGSGTGFSNDERLIEQSAVVGIHVDVLGGEHFEG